LNIYEQYVEGPMSHVRLTLLLRMTATAVRRFKKFVLTGDVGSVKISVAGSWV
jgi:hypothetical protein